MFMNSLCKFHVAIYGYGISSKEKVPGAAFSKKITLIIFLAWKEIIVSDFVEKMKL